MKEKIISILTFISIFSLSFFYLNSVFQSKELYVNSIIGFKELAKKTNIDVLFLGSSYTYRSLNPLIIDKNCKTISYNLASVSLSLFLNEIIVEESLKYTKPKLLIIEANRWTMSRDFLKSKKGKGFQLVALDNLSFSKKKVSIIRSIYDTSEYISVINPLIRNHSKWNEIDYNIMHDKKVKTKYHGFFKGYKTSIHIVDDEKSKKYKKFRALKIANKKEDNPFDPVVKKEFIKLAKLAKEKNIELLFVTPPYPDARESYFYFNEIEKQCATLGVNFLNFNDYYKELNLTIDDFHDLHHVNTYGSIKVTRFLSEYINNNYTLSDRSSEKIWKNETKNYQDFKDTYYDVDFNAIDNKSMNTIFDKEYKFDSRIVLEKISILSKEADTYNIFLHFKEETDIEYLKSFTLSNRFYPKDSTLLISEKEKKEKKIKFAHHIKIQMFNNKPTVIIRNVKIKPKEFNKWRFHLYKSGKVLNNKILEIKNIKLDK